MCRSLKVLCAAPGPERLQALKEASVGAAWELVGGVASLEELESQLLKWSPDVLVIDAAMHGAAGISANRPLRTVLVGDGADGPTSGPVGAETRVSTLDDVRAAILGIRAPGGPVRTDPSSGTY